MAIFKWFGRGKRRRAARQRRAVSQPRRFLRTVALSALFSFLVSTWLIQPELFQAPLDKLQADRPDTVATATVTAAAPAATTAATRATTTPAGSAAADNWSLSDWSPSNWAVSDWSFSDWSFSDWSLADGAISDWLPASWSSAEGDGQRGSWLSTENLPDWLDAEYLLSLIPLKEASHSLLNLVGLDSGQQQLMQAVAPPTQAAGQATHQPMVQTTFAQCPQFFPEGQLPRVPAAEALRELCFSSFAILHSGQTKTPVFVAQRLNRKKLQDARGVKRNDRFYEEARLPQAERAALGDYSGSGFDRGHMAPAGDMDSDEAMAQSFSLANIVPQDARHNRGPWNQIERATRKYVSRAQGDVFIFTGPVYSANPETIGERQVAIPSHLYKVVYDATTKRAWVHWHENGPDTKVGPPISYQSFVEKTGLDFLQTVELAPAP